MKNIAGYFVNGLLMHRIGLNYYDGGDCSQRCGTYWFLLKCREDMQIDNSEYPFDTKDDFLKAMSQLEVSPGTWRREPYKYNQPEDYSRDQQLPIQYALTAFDCQDILRRLIFKQWKNFGKYQNKDFRTYEWTMDLRGLHWWWMWPLMCVLDVGILINVLMESIIGKINKDNVGNSLNVLLTVIYCSFYYPTPISILCLLLYPKIRNLQYAWSWYFRQPEAPPLDVLAQPIISRL